jgi:hypothetical protein
MGWLDTFVAGFFAGVFGTVLLGCLLAKLLPRKDDYTPNCPPGHTTYRQLPTLPADRCVPPQFPDRCDKPNTSTMHGDD